MGKSRNISCVKNFASDVDDAIERQDVSSLHQFKGMGVSFLKNKNKKDKKKERAVVGYCVSNIYSYFFNKQKGVELERSKFENSIGDLIYYYRLALNLIEEDGSVDTDIKWRIKTNLANALLNTGRFVEAVDLLNEVCEENNKFGMGLSNLGMAMYEYGRYLASVVDGVYFLKRSSLNLSRGLNIGVESHSEPIFREMLENIERAVGDFEDKLEAVDYSLGRSKAEKKYRSWCLKNRLFLNPLNDISMHSVAATDGLNLPSMRLDVGGVPIQYAIFNQMLQDFCSSRYMFYEGIETELYKKHFSDKDVCIYGVHDLRMYGVGIEKIKMSILMAFSIFDKIAYLLNEHFGIGYKKKEVDFNKVLKHWYYKDAEDEKNDKKSYKERISEEVLNLENEPLMALYWLRKDLAFNRGQSEIDPEGKTIKEIRDHITHKYLVVYDDYATFEEKGANGVSYNVTYSSLVESALKVLKLSRSALIYCASAFYVEEQRRNKNRREDELVIEMSLEPI